MYSLSSCVDGIGYIDEAMIRYECWELFYPEPFFSDCEVRVYGNWLMEKAQGWGKDES